MSCLEQYCMIKWLSSLRLWYEPKKAKWSPCQKKKKDIVCSISANFLTDLTHGSHINGRSIKYVFPHCTKYQMELLAEFPQSETVPPSGRTPAPSVQYVTMSSVLYTAPKTLTESLRQVFFSRSMTSSKCAAMLMAVKCVPLNLGCPRAKPWAALMTFCWVIANTTITRICLQRWWLQQPRWWCPEYYPQPVGSRSLWQSPNIWSLWQC